MAQDPNAHANDNGNGDGNGDGDGEPKTQLEMAMDNLLALGIPNLQPLNYTEQQMNAGTVGEMNDWAKANLDAASFREYRVLRRKDIKVEWLVMKIKAINEARASLLKRLEGAPAVQQQQQPKPQPQQQPQPGAQGGDDDQEMKDPKDGNGDGNGAPDDKEDKTEKRFKKMEETILNMQNMFNQVLDDKYKNGEGNSNNGKGKGKIDNEEKLDEKDKKKMNEDLARLMNTQRVANGSNVCIRFRNLIEFRYFQFFPLLYFILVYYFYFIFILILFFCHLTLHFTRHYAQFLLNMP